MVVRSLRFVVALAAFLVASSAAQAQEKPDYDAARKHYLGAKESMGKRDYPEAIRQYIQAYDITKDPSLFKPIAAAYEAAGQKKEAVVYYRRYLAESKPGPDAAEVKAKIAELEGAGAPAPPATAPAERPPPPPEQPAPELPPAPPLYQEPGGSWQRASAWVAVGVTVVLLTTGSVLATSAAAREDDLQRLVDFRDPETGQPKEYAGSTREDYQNKSDEGKRLAKFATYSFIAAGACAGTAILFFVLDATRGVEAPAHGRVLPTVGPRLVGIVAGWEL